MRLEVEKTVDEAAASAARLIATVLGIGIARRTRATLALSGGNSPVPMLRELVRQPLDWTAIHVYQVDERVVARGEVARNLTRIEEVLVANGPLPHRNLHPMWVDRADLLGSVAEYATEIEQLAGVPAVLDAVHLGLGTDGHTASLFSGDAALKVKDRAVALTGEHHGYTRMTLTLPVINRARSIIWFVTGADKAGVLADLYAGGAPFPAARVARVRAVIVADSAAAKDAGAPKRRRTKAKSKVVPLRRRS